MNSRDGQIVNRRQVVNKRVGEVVDCSGEKVLNRSEGLVDNTVVDILNSNECLDSECGHFKIGEICQYCHPDDIAGKYGGVDLDRRGQDVGAAVRDGGVVCGAAGEDGGVDRKVGGKDGRVDWEDVVEDGAVDQGTTVKDGGLDGGTAGKDGTVDCEVLWKDGGIDREKGWKDVRVDGEVTGKDSQVNLEN